MTIKHILVFAGAVFVLFNLGAILQLALSLAAFAAAGAILWILLTNRKSFGKG